jgi:hypothetical protein
MKTTIWLSLEKNYMHSTVGAWENNQHKVPSKRGILFYFSFKIHPFDNTIVKRKTMDLKFVKTRIYFLVFKTHIGDSQSFH